VRPDVHGGVRNGRGDGCCHGGCRAHGAAGEAAPRPYTGGAERPRCGLCLRGWVVRDPPFGRGRAVPDPPALAGRQSSPRDDDRDTRIIDTSGQHRSARHSLSSEGTRAPRGAARASHPPRRSGKTSALVSPHPLLLGHTS
jgi:hypothetical protein